MISITFAEMMFDEVLTFLGGIVFLLLFVFLGGAIWSWRKSRKDAQARRIWLQNIPGHTPEFNQLTESDDEDEDEDEDEKGKPMIQVKGPFGLTYDVQEHEKE